MNTVALGWFSLKNATQIQLQQFGRQFALLCKVQTKRYYSGLKREHMYLTRKTHFERPLGFSVIWRLGLNLKMLIIFLKSNVTVFRCLKIFLNNFMHYHHCSLQFSGRISVSFIVPASSSAPQHISAFSSLSMIEKGLTNLGSQGV